MFSRLGQDNKYRHEITPDVALGSMLHVVQDSFSSAHTCRIVHGDGASRRAVLADVYNYSEQNADKHGSLVYPSWLKQYVMKGERTYDNDPVVVGAWLLRAVDEKIPWAKVEQHLRDTIFAHAEPTTNMQKEACISLSTGQTS